MPMDPQPAEPVYRLIPLTQGQFAKVDPEDYDWLMQWKWFARWNKRTNSFYADRQQSRTLGKPRKSIHMHSFIAGSQELPQVDHINHDTLDNRRFNLRPATRSQNGYNRRIFRNNTSGFKGVIWNSHSAKYQARIMINSQRIHLGFYSTLNEAAAAYRKAALELHGEFACFE